jgi:hypothetical protein
MQERREQLLQELRKAEQARDLLSELERLPKVENHPELERCLTQLKQLAQSLPEGHSVRLLIESAIRPEMVGRARSALEGEVKLANHHQRTTFHTVTEGRFSEVHIARSTTTQQTRFALPGERVGLLIVCQHKHPMRRLCLGTRRAH